MGSISRSTFSLRTGVATLGSLPADAQLAMAVGRLPREVPTGPIFHELVHHIAAISPVNVAMQSRWLALLRVALSSRELGAPEGREGEMAASLAAAEAVLQPIAEGLALFAEFDCAVPEPDRAARWGEVTSIDMISVFLLSLKEGVGGRLPDLHRASVAEKQSSDQVRRRADVLSHPLYPHNANDAYLIGYLLIKTARVRYEQLGGTGELPASAFLNFVHYWFYEDWELARLLLQPGISATHAVLERLSARARALLESDLPDREQAFRRDLDARHARGMLMRGAEERAHGPLAGLAIELEEIADAQLALAEYYLTRISPDAPLTARPAMTPKTEWERVHAELLKPVPADQAVPPVYFEHADEFETLRTLDLLLEIPRHDRRQVALFDLGVELELTGGRIHRVRVDEPGAPWHEASIPVPVVGAETGAAKAWLRGTMITTETPWCLECSAVIDGATRAIWGFGSARSADDHRAVAARIALREEFRTNWGQTPEAFLQMIAATVGVGPDATSPAAQRANEATEMVAMSLREILADHGMRGLLSANPALRDVGIRSWLPRRSVSALAATGLVNSYSVQRAEIAQQLAAQGHDLDELIDECSRLAADHGVSLLECDDREVRALV